MRLSRGNHADESADSCGWAGEVMRMSQLFLFLHGMKFNGHFVTKITLHQAEIRCILDTIAQG